MTDELNSEGGGCGHRKPQDFDSSLVADAIDYKSSMNIAANTTQPVWLSVKVPAQAAPGTYKGTLTVKNNKGVTIKTLSYDVTVNHRTLPDAKDWSYHWTSGRAHTRCPAITT